MKPLSLTFLVLAMLPLFAADVREPKLRAAMDSFANCWTEYNKSGCFEKSILAPDFSHINRNARRGDRTSFVEAFRSGTMTTGKYETPANTEIRFLGSTALVVYARPLPWGNRDTPEANRVPVDHQVTQVWIELNGRWLLSHMHVSYPAIMPAKK